MASKTHEVRDPIHVFIRVTSEERALLDSRPFQRLRHIYQLALTYLVYPGATHCPPSGDLLIPCGAKGL